MKTVMLLTVVFGLAAQVLLASQTTAVSISGEASISASGHSYGSLLSADRRYIVFVSSAKNLIANDNLAPYLDVFRHDLQTGETVLISRAFNGNGGANADSKSPSVSSNGQWIAFASAATDLLPGADTNFSSDIFLANANSGTLSLISAAHDGTTPANPVLTRNLPLSEKPLISADGRWVAFESFATNLTAEFDTNNSSDVFLRDALNNRTVLISVALPGGITANGESRLVAITPDANCILFSSTATNVAPGSPTTRNEELYVRDLAAGVTTWIPHFDPSPNACRFGSISSDGRYVLYKVESPPGYGRKVVLHDRFTTNDLLFTLNVNTGYPVHMSSDGRFISYDQYGGSVALWDRQTRAQTLVNGTAVSHSPTVTDNGSIVSFVNAAPNMPFQIWYRNMATNQPRRVTETTSGSPSGKDHNSSAIILDPAGEFILFDSAEDNLVAGDHNHATDIFIHRIATGETRLISRAHESAPPFTSFGVAGITNFCLSSDGNRLLFFSSDSNLVPGDTNGWQDAFLRDLRTGQTFALTTNANGLFSNSNSVPSGLLSANGRFALLGLLDSLSGTELYGGPATIIRKDLDTGETLTLISNAYSSAGVWPSQMPFFAFSISADGNRVAYPSNDLIIVANLQTGVQTNLTPSDPNWNAPLLSPDGRYVAYSKGSLALALTDLLTAERIIIASNYLRAAAFTQNGQHIVYARSLALGSSVFLYSIAPRSNMLVCTNCINASISADAQFVVYEKTLSGSRQLELKDTFSGRTTSVTRNINGIGGANTDSTSPVISTDGRFVAYTSTATNLTVDIPNGWNNLYIYDRLQGSTLRVTGARSNTGYGSGSASRPVLGADGRTLVFQSFASDFVANDFNDTRDIFLLRLGEGDTDNDGMSDSWEQTYFSTINRDGTADFDNDGQTDLAEYLAGTNPADGQSVLEVLQITSVNTGQRQLIWSAQPGKSYRLEYKSDLAGSTWTSLGQVITATGPTSSAIDTTAGAPAKRFYRVALIQ